MIKNVEKKSENCKIHKKSENCETPYKNLEKYGSFSEFRTSTEKSVMLATLAGITNRVDVIIRVDFGVIIGKGIGVTGCAIG